MTAADLAEEITREVGVCLEEKSGPVVVMVTGPPAMGKTALCTEVARRLGRDRVLTLVDDREIYSREVRDRLGVTGIDHAARHMGQLQRDLIALRKGRTVPDKAYRRCPDRAPRLVSSGTLSPKAVILLDGFAWCYPDFDGLWDLKYVLLPSSFEQSERMSSRRDKAERHYSDHQADAKHRATYKTFARHESTLCRNADRVYRVSADYQFELERDVQTTALPASSPMETGRHGTIRSPKVRQGQ